MGSPCKYEAKKKRDLKVQREKTLKLRETVFGHYGGKCLSCGITDLEVLTIDHVNDDGVFDRQKWWDNSGRAIYQYLIENNFPEGYQVLCRNCNWKKYLAFLRRIKPSE
jgi:hypothetical protein